MAEEIKETEEQNTNIEPTNVNGEDNVNLLSDEEIGDLFNDLLSGKDKEPTEEDSTTQSTKADEDEKVDEEINSEEQNIEEQKVESNNEDEHVNSEDDETKDEKPIEEIQEKLMQEDEEPTEEEVNKVIEEYNKLKEFYERATKPIKLGDNEVAIDNPELIAQAKKAAIVLSKKYEKFKKYVPQIKVLEKYNLLEPEKLQLAIDAINGKQEALLHLLKQNNINIEEIDLEELPEYKPKPELPSKLEIELEDLIDTADALGLGDKIKSELVDAFDDNSVVEIVEHPSLKNELLQHMEIGIYDEIKNRIKQKEAIDFVGSYKSKPFLQKYREEAAILEQELLELAKQQEQQEQQQQDTKEPNKEEESNKNDKEPEITEEMIREEMERIKKELEYKRKVEEKKNKISAANNIKREPSQAPKKKSIDELSDEEIENIFNSLL